MKVTTKDLKALPTGKHRKGVFIAAALIAVFITFGFSGKALSLNVIYSGRDVVDFEIGAVCGTNIRCELHRNLTDVVMSQENSPDKYFYGSDTVPEPGLTYTYELRRYYLHYVKNEWLFLDSFPPITVDTALVKGKIHNDDAWQVKLGRNAVAWNPQNGTYYVVGVEVVDGYLEIHPNTQVVFDKRENVSGDLVVTYPGQLIAEEAVFRKSEYNDQWSSIYLKNQNNPLPQTLKKCQLTDIRVEIERSRNVSIIENTFNIVDLPYSEVLHASDSSENLIQGNTIKVNKIGATFAATISGDSNTIKDNSFDQLSVTGNSNLVEGNDCNDLSIASVYIENVNMTNTVRKNAVNRGMHVYGENIAILDNVVNGFIDCDESCYKNTIKGNVIRKAKEQCLRITGHENVIEGNLIEECGIGIQLNYSKNNLIKKNNILKNKGCGIYLRGDSTSNHIEYNAINENARLDYICRGGIFFENSYFNGDESTACTDNVVAFNHFWGNWNGIVFSGAKAGHVRNGFHENIIENSAYYGVSIEDDTDVAKKNSNNTFYNNLFRGNKSRHAIDLGKDNIWNKPKEAVNSNIVGGPFLGGNYWDNYTGVDADGDQIGDTPHPLTNLSNVATNYDNLPLKPATPPDPRIAVDKTTLNFGSLAVGAASAPQTVTISNSGSTKLSIGQLYIGGTDPLHFKIQNDNCSGQALNQSATCTAQTIFNPRAGGTKTAKLVITSNDPAQHAVEASLSGDAKVPVQATSSVSLGKGWNFISLTAQPLDGLLNTIFKDVSPNVRVAWGFDNQNKRWLKYKPSAASNDLSAIELGKGYWVYMDASANLSVVGLDVSSNIQLYREWNLIGYSGAEGASVLTALNVLSDKWNIIWNWNTGQWYAKHATVSNLPALPLDTLNKGKAYWIKMKETAEWIQ